jgi:hypothetical protein
MKENKFGVLDIPTSLHPRSEHPVPIGYGIGRVPLQSERHDEEILALFLKSSPARLGRNSLSSVSQCAMLV